MTAFDTSALKPVGQQPLPSAAPANLDFSSLRPVNSNSPVAPSAPTPTSPAPAGNDDFLGQAGAGLVTGIPNAVVGLVAAGERGRKMGLIVPGMDIIGGMIEPVIDPLLGRKPIETTVDKDIMGALSAAHLNPNDYFPEPTGTWGRIGRMVGEGAISSIVPGGEETGIARLLQMGKQFIAGGVGGGAAQTVMETPLPDQVKPLASLAAGIAAGGAGLAATEIPETIAKGVSKVGEHITPAFAGDATHLAPEAAANTIAGKLAAERLGAYAENPEAAISNIQNATELVPGSAPTSAQAAQDRGLLGLERALARNDDKFKAALLDRTDQQNAARVSALDNIESTGDIGSAVQFFHDRMQQLEDHADTLYNRAQQAAEGHYGALGDKTATETGEQARQAIANRFKSMNAEISALWKSIDPTGELHVATAPLVDAAAKIYGTMSPEGSLSLSASERNVANIIGNYGDTLPFDRFKDLRSEITRAMRESRSFANPNEQAYRRLSMLRDSVEQAVEQSVTHQFETNPSLADQFVRQTKDWYENARTAETGAAPAPSTGAGPVETARGPAVVSGTAGDQGLEPRGPASDQGLPGNDAGVGKEFEQSALRGRLPESDSLAIPDAPTKADMDRASRVESVPLSQVRGTQPKMDWTRFKAGDHPNVLLNGYGDLPVAVRKENGEHLIYDGHHRTTAALNEGRQSMDMHVIDAKDYAPELAGRKPAPQRGMSDDELLRQLNEKPSLKQSGSGAIADTMAQRFAAAGRPEQEAKAAGEVVDAFYNTMAKRLGVPVDKLIEQHPLPQVERGGAGGQFDQAPPPKSEAFKKWFGSSKVVDEHGAPLVVYHGTRDAIEAFDPKKTVDHGFHFGTEDQANVRVGIKPGQTKEGRNIMPVYLDIEKPRRSMDEGGNWKSRIAAAKKAGHDGIVYLNRYEGIPLEEFTAARRKGIDLDKISDEQFRKEIPSAHDSYIAFDPTQIKSVNNRGTFDPNDPRILYQPAYHGTPHIFDKFDSSKIGTGEGAQAFGHGLYFAGRKGIAEYYRDKLAGDDPDLAMHFSDGHREVLKAGYRGPEPAEHFAARSIRDEEWSIQNPRPGDQRTGSAIDRAIDGMREEAEKAEAELVKRRQDEAPRAAIQFAAGLAKLNRDAIAVAERWKADGLQTIADQKPGRLYHVDVPEEHELLDWDKPLSEQPERVKAFARKNKIPTERNGVIKSGAALYKWIANQLGSEQAASKAFSEAGIPGHRFLDQQSRGNPAYTARLRDSLKNHEAMLARGIPVEDTIAKIKADIAKYEDVSHNYVIYDDSRINVTNYEQPARGSIRFGDTGSVMSMFEGADASTAMHEAGHHFLHMFRSMADGPNAPEAIAKDWQATNAWWDKNAGDIASEVGNGVTAADVRAALRKGTSGDVAKDRAIDVGLHEQWARGFESYLRDGKAPNPALRSIFEQFKDWLSQVYAHATQLGVKMSPEIKGVFDRMLSTDRPKMMDEGAAARLSKATAATRELKDTFGAKPVKQILRRPGTTYPYDMSAENVAANLFKPGPEGASSIRNTLRAGAPRETIESAAALSLKRAATKDGVLDPAKVAAWRQKHAEALGEVPELDKRVRTAASASEALADIGQRRKDALDMVQKSAVGKLLNVEDNADVAAVVGRMLGKDTAVKDMRSLVTEARNNPEALAGLRRAVVEHMVSKLKTPKDALRPDTFQRFLGKNAPALAQVLEPEQMQALRSIAQDLKRASRDVRAPGGGSDTAENLAARSKYGLEQPSLLNQIIKRAISSAAIGAGTHFLSGPLVGLASTAGSFLGGTVLQAFREAGLRHVDDLIKEAALHPDLMKALLMKAPKSPKAGSIVKFTDQLGRLAQANLVMSASRDREPHGRKRATVH